MEKYFIFVFVKPKLYKLVLYFISDKLIAGSKNSIVNNELQIISKEIS